MSDVIRADQFGEWLNKWAGNKVAKSQTAEKIAVKETANLLRQVTEPFVRYESGTMNNSAYTSSNLDAGEVIYDTPYAKATYLSTKSNVTKDMHPLACAEWGKVSIAKHKKDLVQCFNDAYMRELNKK